MRQPETFEADGVIFDLAPESHVGFQDGALCVLLVTQKQPYDAAKHAAFLNYDDHVRLTVRIRQITFPTARIQRTLEYPRAMAEAWLGFDGFTGRVHPLGDVRLEFTGSVTVAEDWLEMDGIVRDQSYPPRQTSLVIRKRFEPGPVDPRLYVHHDLRFALSLDPQLVAHLGLYQSGQPIPAELFQLHHLESLTLRYFADEQLPDLFDQLPHLQRLTLMDMPFTQLPPSVCTLTQLRELSVWSVPLNGLPESIANLTALRELSITGAELQTVPDSLFRLPSLHSVSLSWNKLTDLPPSVGTGPQLQRLRLDGNIFTHLPSSLAEVPEVFIEAKFKPLYTKARYKSKNRKKIQQHLFSTAGNPAFVATLNREIMRHGLAEYRNELLVAARLGITLITETRDDYSSLGNTRLGGDPDLPASTEYPRIDGQLPTFLAQINLAELAPHQQYLPRVGLLSCFALLTTEEEVRPPVVVLYHADTSDLRRVQSPRIAACRQKPYQSFRTIVRAGCSLPVLKAPERQLPREWQSLTRIAADPDLARDYTELCKDVSGNETHDRNDAHGINTYVYAQIEPPEQRACEVHGGLTQEWMVLLSLSSDDNPGFCFLDGGTMTLCIHKKDLAIVDFSKVVASIESS